MFQYFKTFLMILMLHYKNLDAKYIESNMLNQKQYLFLVKHFSTTTKNRIRILKFGNGVCVTAKQNYYPGIRVSLMSILPFG